MDYIIVMLICCRIMNLFANFVLINVKLKYVVDMVVNMMIVR